MLPSLRILSTLTSFCLAATLAAASPTGFIENRGQIQTPTGAPVPTVRYLLSTPGLNVQLRAAGFSYDTWTRTGEREQRGVRGGNGFCGTGEKTNCSYNFHRVDIQFLGASSSVAIHPTRVAEDVLNYYGAATPADGVTGVRHFSTVTYENVWPGIDVEFEARPKNNKPVEYNFILHPGARVSDIRLQYSGADATALINDALEFKVTAGMVTESIPASYWAQTRKPATIHYTVISQRAGEIIVGFTAPTADFRCRDRLIIDPSPYLAWGTYYGGASTDVPSGTAGDTLGNSYFSGFTQSTTAIATTGAHKTSFSGTSSAFLVKFDKTGARHWGTYYGDSDGARDVAVSKDGTAIYMAGHTQSANGISTSGAHQENIGGMSLPDAYLVRFDGSGVRQWGTYYGGAGTEYAWGVALDDSGFAYVCGSTNSLTNIASANAHQSTLGSGSIVNGPADGFVAKFSSAGIRQWGTYYGGTDNDYVYALGADSIGSLYITGYTFSTTGIATTGAHQTTMMGGPSLLVKFNASGARAWGTYYGGSSLGSETYGRDVAVSRSGKVYVCGQTAASVGIATPGSYQPAFTPSSSAGSDGFFVHFNSNGVRQWGTYYGGSESDGVSGIALDSAGNIYIAGSTTSANGISTPNGYKPVKGFQDVDAFIALFNSSGFRQWGTYFGGDNNEFVTNHCLALSGKNALGFPGIHLAGQTASPTGIAMPNAHQPALSTANQFDGFFTGLFVCSPGAPPSISCTASPTGPVCAKAPVTFTATPGPSVSNPSIQWSRNGSSINGATSLTFTTSSLVNGDVIRAVISAQSICGDVLWDSSSAITMTILPPPMPVITAVGNVLSTQHFVSYQWLNNGVPLAGATSQSFTAMQPGAYRVIVTGGNGCSDTSGIFYFTTAVKNVEGIGAAIRIFPNPTSNILNIESPVAVDAVVRGVDGREVMRAKAARALLLGALPDGLYFVSLMEQGTGAVVRVEKLTKGR